MRFDYVYLVCYWEGSNRLKTIEDQWFFINNYRYIKDKSVLFVVCQRGENVLVETEINNILKENRSENVTPIVLVRKNWGMLTGSLWDTWQYCKEKEYTANYIVAVEDDWIFNNWAQREKYLDKDIYVGHFSVLSFGDRNINYYLKAWEIGCKHVVDGTDDGVKARLKILGASVSDRFWTDGGVYFMKFSSLNKIEASCGIFNKCPQSEIVGGKANYHEHGIAWGELGFPAMLHSRGYSFAAFPDHTFLNKRGSTSDLSQLMLSQDTNFFSNNLSDSFLNDCYFFPTKDMIKIEPKIDISNILIENKIGAYLLIKKD